MIMHVLVNIMAYAMKVRMVFSMLTSPNAMIIQALGLGCWDAILDYRIAISASSIISKVTGAILLISVKRPDMSHSQP